VFFYGKMFGKNIFTTFCAYAVASPRQMIAYEISDVLFLAYLNSNLATWWRLSGRIYEEGNSGQDFVAMRPNMVSHRTLASY